MSRAWVGAHTIVLYRIVVSEEDPYYAYLSCWKVESYGGGTIPKQYRAVDYESALTCYEGWVEGMLAGCGINETSRLFG